MRVLTTCLLLVLLSVAANAQCCGDCNGNGRVTVNEILATVDNALGECAIVPTPVGTTPAPTPAATPTALADQCSTDTPGTRLTVLGTNYVVVEYEVLLENSTQTYVFRRPTALDVSGHLTNVQNPIYLQQTCKGSPHPCGVDGFGGYPGSVCGFPALFFDSGGVTGGFRGGATTSYTEGGSGVSWTYETNGFLSAYVTVDAAHEPIYFYFFSNSSPARTISVPDLSTHGYSFAKANYPEPSSTELAQFVNALSALFAHVSLQRASLPTPPTFPKP